MPTLSEALTTRGHDVEWTPWGSTKTRIGSLLRPVTVFRDAWKARRLARVHRADVVMIHTAHDFKALVRDLVAVVLLHGGQAPIVYFLHGSTPQWLETGPGGMLSRLTLAVLRRVDVLLVLSADEEAAWCRVLPALHVVRVRNPLPGLADHDSTDASDRVPARGTGTLSRIRLLFVARLVHGKGTEEAIRALAVLRTTREGELRIAGAGPERPRLEILTGLLGIEDDVHFLGQLDAADLHEEYVAADALVFPTRLNEGLPTVLLEAAAVGLPSITTAARGAVDYFTDGEDILFIDPEDSSSIVRAIERVMDEPGLVAHMSRALPSLVEQFDPAAVVEEYEAVMDDVLARGSA